MVRIIEATGKCVLLFCFEMERLPVFLPGESVMLN